MAAGRCDDLIGSVRFGSVRFGSVRFGSVRQEHSALFAVCQVISHKNNRKFTAGDGASCALPLAFLYLGAVMPYGNAKAAVK